MKLPEKYKKAIISRLKPLNPEQIILFGSYARGDAKEGSDVDLLVVTKDDFLPASFDEKIEVYLKYSSAIKDLHKDIPIDLLVHTKKMHEKFISLNSSFFRTINKDGCLLK
jgi:predicted nucleotidyltransferase